MAKRKAKAKATNPTPPEQHPAGWLYTGPPYKRVSVPGVPKFDPATITQARIGVLMDRYPDRLSRYFTRNDRVKPGITTDPTGQQAEEE